VCAGQDGVSVHAREMAPVRVLLSGAAAEPAAPRELYRRAAAQLHLSHFNDDAVTAAPYLNVHLVNAPSQAPSVQRSSADGTVTVDVRSPRHYSVLAVKAFAFGDEVCTAGGLLIPRGDVARRQLTFPLIPGCPQIALVELPVLGRTCFPLVALAAAPPDAVPSITGSLANAESRRAVRVRLNAPIVDAFPNAPAPATSTVPAATPAGKMWGTTLLAAFREGRLARPIADAAALDFVLIVTNEAQHLAVSEATAADRCRMRTLYGADDGIWPKAAGQHKTPNVRLVLSRDSMGFSYVAVVALRDIAKFEELVL
jgi:hypothetical protein